MLVNYIENVFSRQALAVIVTCITDKGWTVTRITKEFPSKKWNYKSINRVSMISSSCKTELRHTVPKQLEIFRDNTPDFISSQEWTPHSPDLNPLDCSIWELGHIAKTCLRRKAWTVRKPQRSWHCYQRKMAWCRWLDSEKSYSAVEMAFSSSGKAELRTYSAHCLLVNNINWWLLWRFGVACVRATTWMMNHVRTLFYDMQHNFVSITANTKAFRRKFPDLFGYVRSLNTCFSVY